MIKMIPIEQLSCPDWEYCDEELTSRNHRYPICVRPFGAKYEVISGRRRFLEARREGVEEMCCEVSDIPDRLVEWARLKLAFIHHSKDKEFLCERLRRFRLTNPDVSDRQIELYVEAIPGWIKANCYPRIYTQRDWDQREQQFLAQKEKAVYKMWGRMFNWCVLTGVISLWIGVVLVGFFRK